MRSASFWNKSLTLCLFTASSYALTDETNTRISALESRMSAIQTETAKQTYGAQMANANPLYDGFGLFVTADLLYWHLYEGGTDYSLSNKVSGPTISGKSSRAHFDWDFGFRVGAGYNFEHDAWDAYVNFTWFRTHASSHAHKDSDETLIPQKGASDIVAADKISAHWHVHNYVLDLELGRRFFLSKFLSLRPQFGIETAWIYQRRHFSTEQGLDPFTGITGESVRGKCNFWGIGPRAGVEGTWYFGRHFSLFGTINGALLWSHFDTRNKEKVQTLLGSSPSLRVSDHFHRLTPNAQFAMGFCWDANINHEMNHIGIKLAYEFQYWWRQNQFLNEQQTSFYGLQHESKDLSLNGVTLDVRFDF